MKRLLKARVTPAAIVGVLMLAAGGGYALASASGSGAINACVNKRSRSLYKTPCHKGDKKITWNIQGPRGPQGPQGPRGPQGPQGVPGTNGTNAATNIVTRYTDTAITANTDVYGDASCNAGEKITGGGFGITGPAYNNSFIIRSGLTYTDPQGGTPQGTWIAGVRSTNTGTLRVWAICASP